MTPSPNAPPRSSSPGAATSPPAILPAGGAFPKLRVLDLFSGIGGFSLGLERTGGFETVAFCEIEPFPRRVLAKHWPGVPIYNDVRTLTADVLRRDGIAVDVITGGFPCQDLSVAGKQRGMGEGTRSGLWSEIVRLVGELRPQYVIVENVAALLAGPSERRGGWFGRVLGDLAECGYDAEWRNIPAAAVGLYQARERVWVAAYPHEVGWRRSGKCDELFDGLRDYQLRPAPPPLEGRGDVERRLLALVAGGVQASAAETCGRDAHGVSEGLDGFAALGNAVVPQIPELIGRAILQTRAAA